MRSGLSADMVFEMMTILLATGAGVSLVLFMVTPREHEGTSQSFVAHGSLVETISLPPQFDIAPISESSTLGSVATTSVVVGATLALPTLGTPAAPSI